MKRRWRWKNRCPICKKLATSKIGTERVDAHRLSRDAFFTRSVSAAEADVVS
jgi:hypothetical protein